jgi:hypothetical protein
MSASPQSHAAVARRTPMTFSSSTKKIGLQRKNALIVASVFHEIESQATVIFVLAETEIQDPAN